MDDGNLEKSGLSEEEQPQGLEGFKMGRQLMALALPVIQAIESDEMISRFLQNPEKEQPFPLGCLICVPAGLGLFLWAVPKAVRRFSGKSYPGTLDVVEYEGEQMQVVARSEGIKRGDAYVLQDSRTGETFRVTGARFKPKVTETPKSGRTAKLDEGVRVTGKLKGGKRE